MEVRFVAPDLRRLDSLRSEALSIPFFEDERPLRGALGLVDWRLSGLVSRLIVDEKIRGARGERLLVPARPKLPFEKLFLFGMGSMRELDEREFERGTALMLDTLTLARVRASVVVLPGRAMQLIAPGPAMELFMRVIATRPEHDEITLVEEADAQRAMAPIVTRERRRARAGES